MDSCGDYQEIALLTVDIQPPFLGDGAGAGGCEVGGNMRVKVVDSDGLTPIPNAVVMLGESELLNAYQESVGSTATGANTARTDAQGYAEFVDFSGNLSGPTTVTAGAAGYAYSTLVEVNASDIVLALDTVQPVLPTATVTGKLSGVGDPSGDNISAGLVFDDMRIEQVMDFRLSSILSDNVCYDSNFFVPDFPIANNIYIPTQWIGVIRLNEKKYTSIPLGVGAHNLVGISGVVGGSTVQNGTILEMLDGFTFSKIGVRTESIASPGGARNADISASTDLAANVTCSGLGAPSGSNVFCLMMGDWDSAVVAGANPGEGDLFVMGLGVERDVGTGGTFNLPNITTVAASGDFAGIEYLAVSVASYFDPEDAPSPALANGVSVIAQRQLAWDGTGGSFVFDDFLPLQTLSRDQHTFSAAVSGAGGAPGAVDFRQTLIRQRIDRGYEVCGQPKVRSEYRPLWSVYTAGATAEFTLPTLPASWPRAAHSGLIDPAISPENDVLEWSHSMVRQGLNPGFDYDAIDFSQVPRTLTHVSTNVAEF